jgi:sigma-B regulation protein RsbU (phosphoserine phosphatase)
MRQALLPAPLKTLSYASACSLNLPCYQVGGDYFDYFDLADGRLGFAIGDVSGKGVPAALMAAKIQGIFSALTTFNLPLPLMIANANRNLAGRPIDSAFVTLFFGVLDSQGNCTYTNAGHNPPILARRDGSLHEMTKGGLVLGPFATDYEAETLRLDPGDHVVLFTDGLLDAQNVAGEDFGKDRLEALIRECATLPASEILSRLHGELDSFCAGAPQRDDITLMVLGFREA